MAIATKFVVLKSAPMKYTLSARRTCDRIIYLFFNAVEFFISAAIDDGKKLQNVIWRIISRNRPINFTQGMMMMFIVFTLISV